MNKLIIFVLITIFAFTTLAFKFEPKSSKTIDIININDFDMCLTTSSYSSLSTILLGESDFLSRFGTPISNSNEYSDEDEAYMKHIVYNGAEIWYMNNHLETLIFTNSNYKFITSNGDSIQVGDNISVVSSMFPNSWNDKITPNQVFVQLQNSTNIVDMTLLFEFDPNTNLITSISLQ
jgi:hypothetical protein